MLLSCQNLSKTYGPKVLFTDLSFGIEDGERLAIIGPNGSGKSTLLKILARAVEADEGKVTYRSNLRVAYVEQQTNFEAGLSIIGAMEKNLRANKMDPDDHMGETYEILGRFGFEEFEAQVSSLSGGWKKRLSFACAMVISPDLLLIDEPTNHLDLEGIESLEEVLNEANFSWALITHDRYLLESVATRILEVNRVYEGGLFAANGSYGDFLEAKALYITGQKQTQESLANKVRREVEWLRRGPKARTTKQQARIQGAAVLQQQLSDLSQRNRETKLSINFNESDRKTKKLISLQNIRKSFGDRTIIKDLDFVLRAGMKVGLLGLNASGKTTLLKIMAETSPVDDGTVERADQLRVVYFEQHRERLDPKISVKRFLAPDSDSVVFNDRSIHVVSWAKRFNFLPEQLDILIGRLSGGEQARLLIAKLMLEPADVLLLDEPTNDLDIETLEVLEEGIDEFRGAVVLVTHDRYLLDRVSNMLLGLDGTGRILEFADYAQWRNFERERLKEQPVAVQTSLTVDKNDGAKAKPSKKLSYNEQRELDQMESNIAAAEEKVRVCQQVLDDPALAANAKKLQEAAAQLAEAQYKVDQLFSRWSELTGSGD